MSANHESMSLETRAVHAGTPKDRVGGAGVLPIFQSSIFEMSPERSSYESILYPRLSNLPNQRALGAKIASLESAEAAVVTASGMAAISTALLSVLKSGDHFLAQDCLYGGTHSLVTIDFRDLNIEFDFISPNNPEEWAAKVRPNTRAIYVEAITNPLVQVIDHPEVVRFAREHNLVSLIDNTFASPVNFRPAEVGYDLILHSCTKYMNGHSDLAAGAVAGKAGLIEQVTHRLNHYGGSLDPHACFLLDRGLKTLVLRVERQNENALALAGFLEGRNEVARVNYPGLPSHPRHSQAQEWFHGCGGMFSFELNGGAPAAQALVENLQIPIHSPSLGGPETLIVRPANSSHAGLNPQERAEMGITDGLIRISSGIESKHDLIADFAQALDKLPGRNEKGKALASERAR